MKKFKWGAGVICLIACLMPIRSAAQLYDYGDAPEGALAYPSNGVTGMFPTCMNVGPASFVQHGWGIIPWAFFGPMADIEGEGNAGLCPFFGYDSDECFADGDAGLIIPTAFTINGMTVLPCPNVTTPISLGPACTTAYWGSNIDIIVSEVHGMDVFVNVLIDWDQSGNWGGSSLCPGGFGAAEHVLINFPVPAGYSGLLSTLGPPPFLIGPIPDFVWVRFSVTYTAVLLPWDGSGTFEDGESEDYLLLIDPGVQPTSTPTNTPTRTPTLTPTPTNTPTQPAEEWGDYGDAPENALAYPSMGGFGFFPTCRNSGPSGWIQHLTMGMYFGPGWTIEVEGNANTCPVFTGLYDMDECMNDGDAGLLIPGAFTILGPTGSENEAPCPLSGGMGIPLGLPCQPALWGPQIDILIQNNAPVPGFINVIADWDQNGIWSGGSTCPGGIAVPEHVLTNFPVPPGFGGPLAALGPAPFTIGPNSGFVWVRFTISDVPMILPWDGSGYSGLGETEDYMLYIEPDQPPTATPTGPTPTPTTIPPIPATGAAGSILLLFIVTLTIGLMPKGRG